MEVVRVIRRSEEIWGIETGEGVGKGGVEGGEVGQRSGEEKWGGEVREGSE